MGCRVLGLILEPLIGRPGLPTPASGLASASAKLPRNDRPGSDARPSCVGGWGTLGMAGAIAGAAVGIPELSAPS